MITRNKEIESVRIESIEDVSIGGRFLRKTLSLSQNMELTEATLNIGTIIPTHIHRNWESVGYVVEGKLRMIIEGEEHILERGDSWYHPQNIAHSTEALENTKTIEVFNPPI